MIIIFCIYFLVSAILLATIHMLPVRCDYCRLNCNQYQNIGCQNNGVSWKNFGFSKKLHSIYYNQFSAYEKNLKSSCPDNAITYTYDQEDIKLWLKLHNEYRNKIANGSIDGYESASRMTLSVWFILMVFANEGGSSKKKKLLKFSAFVLFIALE